MLILKKFKRQIKFEIQAHEQSNWKRGDSFNDMTKRQKMNENIEYRHCKKRGHKTDDCFTVPENKPKFYA